jgi:cytochrome c5
MKKTFVILSAVLIFTACASRKNKQAVAPSPTPAPAMASTPEETEKAHMDKVLATFPNYTAAEFNDGKMLYEKNCGSCHMLKDPRSESEPAWREIVPDMVNKANRKGSAIDASQQDLILKYVVSLSNNPN